MRARVQNVVGDSQLELDKRWCLHGESGRRVRIAGLLPSPPNERENAVLELSQLLLGREVSLDRVLFHSGEEICAVLSLNGRPLQEYFPHRSIPVLPPLESTEPLQDRVMVVAPRPLFSAWRNPLNTMHAHELPFFDSIEYPSKPWEADNSKRLRLAECLYVPAHGNAEQLARWFSTFLAGPGKEAPLIVVGEAGIGKSWWIRHTLMALPKDEYDVFVFDLRFVRRGDTLSASLELELDQYLTHYVRNLTWLNPEYAPIYGADFDPSNPTIQCSMQQAVMKMPLAERNAKRLRHYGRAGAPTLVVLFDNIDHFSESEQLETLDTCRRIIGHASGAKTIVTMRPNTLLPKARLSLFFGDSTQRGVVLKSPDIYTVLERRFSTNMNGDPLDSDRHLPSSLLTWRSLLHLYRQSDPHGLAGLISDLCSTESETVTPGNRVHDIRHYLKLFRRVLQSDSLRGFENITSQYYGVEALFAGDEQMVSESGSFLFNLFDNGRPMMPGNTLVRYRVLEYALHVREMGRLFDSVFTALGPGPTAARDVVALFVEAGLISIDRRPNRNAQTFEYAELTVAGRRHLELVTNLWYIICVKHATHVPQEYIVYGEGARQQASELVQSKALLDAYAATGWVSEERFAAFLAKEELWEHLRAKDYEKANPEGAKAVSDAIAVFSSASEIVYYSVMGQMKMWERNRMRVKGV